MHRQRFEAQTSFQALILEQAFLLARQLEQTAADDPDGQVLSRVEALAVQAARELARKAVEATLPARVLAVEKTGPRSAPAHEDSAWGTKGRPRATS